jgi:hypothetical protein
MTVDQIIGDAWHVVNGGEIIAGPFPTNEAGWAWIDRHHGEGKHVSRFPVSGGVMDRAALDLKQIELIIRIEMLEALQRALPQIAAVLREAYPNTDEEGIPD